MDAEAQIKVKRQKMQPEEVNKALSAEQLTLRRDWTTKQNELKEMSFL